HAPPRQRALAQLPARLLREVSGRGPADVAAAGGAVGVDDAVRRVAQRMPPLTAVEAFDQSHSPGPSTGHARSFSPVGGTRRGREGLERLYRVDDAEAE